MAQFHDPVMRLPEPYYAAIGEMLFRFWQLEYQMHEIVWFASGIEYKIGRILTIGTDVKVLCGQINNLAGRDRWVRSARLRQEMNSIANNARKLAKPRNQLAHGSWQAPGRDPQKAVLHFMMEKEDRFLPRFDPKFDDTHIRSITGKLRDLNERARKLILDLRAEQRASPGKSA